MLEVKEIGMEEVIEFSLEGRPLWLDENWRAKDLRPPVLLHLPLEHFSPVRLNVACHLGGLLRRGESGAAL